MSELAVIVIDMLNPYDHEDADELADHVAEIVGPLSELIASAHEADAELVYVNDNHGDFGASRHDLVARALDGRRPELVEPIVPPDHVDFLAKVRHSAFYSTTLDYLLQSREVQTVVLAGQVTEQCILYSALDAHVRHFDIRVPRDAVAGIDDRLAEAALEMMRRNMHVDVIAAADGLVPLG
jgi:nicotinamidase-related amidase